MSTHKPIPEVALPRPKLTIGMATYDDFDGVYFSIQALRLLHPEILLDTEFIIIDNNPGSPHNQALHGFIGWIFGQTRRAMLHTGGNPTIHSFQFMELKEPVGTSAPRDMVFRVATGEFVLCIDSHVLIPQGALKRLLQWLDHNKDSMDLLSGPLLYDGFDTYSTHFDDMWREQMWGVWGTARACICKEFYFSCHPTPNQQVMYIPLQMNPVPITSCPVCYKQLPAKLPWARHEEAMERAGYKEIARDVNHPAFEIPAQGLGLFGCRKEAWLGFNKNFRGFGGEEHYIHAKFRNAGRRNLCLPFLRWVHRFGKVQGQPPTNSNWNKCRNYVIGHAELGLPYDNIKKMFVDGGLVPKEEWDELMQNPYNPIEWPSRIKAAPPPGQVVMTEEKLLEQQGNKKVQTMKAWVAPAQTLDQWFAHIKTVTHDFTGHEDKIKSYAQKCKHITELGGRRGSSTVCLLAGRPDYLTVIDPNPGQEWGELVRLSAGTIMKNVPQRSEVALPEETDLLFIDTNHHYDQLTEELSRYASYVHKYIIIHDTVLHGIKGEDNKPGLLPAIKQFLDDAGGDGWYLAVNDRINWGLVILSCVESEKPQEDIPLYDATPPMRYYPASVTDNPPQVQEVLANMVAKGSLDLSKLTPEQRQNIERQLGNYIREQEKRRQQGNGVQGEVRVNPVVNPGVTQEVVQNEVQSVQVSSVQKAEEGKKAEERKRVAPPGFGPGTELKIMLSTLGINPSETCDCNGKAVQMDLWGVEGCKENRETIIGWMKDGQKRWGWKDKVAAATKAVLSGLAFKLNVVDPYPGLIDEAIRRAEEKEGRIKQEVEKRAKKETEKVG